MSSMLEQAIVDAAALREAAIQSAEQAVVEQYSGQIKETVEKLLEQEELAGMDPALDLGMEEPTGEPAPAGPAAKAIANDADVKQAEAVGGIAGQTLEAFYESLAEDIDENTVLEIELDNLDYDAVRGTGKDKITPMREQIEEAVDAGDEEDDSMDCTADADCPEGQRCGDLMACTSEPELADEPLSLDEELLDELAETLTMDYKAQPDGGFANGQMKPTNAFHDTQIVQEIAAEIEEYAEEQKKKNDTLQKENKQYKAKNLQLIKELKEVTGTRNRMLEAVGQIKQKFESVHLMNAKLFYINKALMDVSLNERQKGQIVESINNVDSIESAKIVFETLRSTVGPSNNRKPNSLSEAVNKRNSSSILLHSRKKEEKNNNTDDFTKRMRRLAGIE